MIIQDRINLRRTCSTMEQFVAQTDYTPITKELDFFQVYSSITSKKNHYTFLQSSSDSTRISGLEMGRTIDMFEQVKN